MLYDDTVILVFAKAPIEGKVNTRLIPDIGVQAATDLQQDLIHNRLLMLTQAGLCSVVLMCAPDTLHECFVHCKQKYAVTVKQQKGNGLGIRMLNAAAEALEKYKYCIIIGTDAPTLDVDATKQAIEKLKAGLSVVFVPAEDGGYVLVGMQQAYNFLFQHISWGSAEVMQQSRESLMENHVVFAELSPCWDIDRIEDYQRYLALRS